MHIHLKIFFHLQSSYNILLVCFRLYSSIWSIFGEPLCWPINANAGLSKDSDAELTSMGLGLEPYCPRTEL